MISQQESLKSCVSQNRRKLVFGFLCWWKTKLEGNCVFGKVYSKGMEEASIQNEAEGNKTFCKILFELQCISN